MGQLFYSMSLSMGIMITYGSYMKKDVSLESSVRHIEIFDTAIAFIAGLMIIPAIYSTSAVTGSPVENYMTKGAGLMFSTLPLVFANMPGGSVIGTLFFLLVIFAALTSSISLMEAVVSIVHDKFNIGRKMSCIVTIIISILLGVPSSLGFGPLAGIKIFGKSIFDFFDFASNSVLMPVAAFFTCILVGYVIKPKAIIEEAEISGEFKAKRLFTIGIKYFAPIFILAILVFSVLENTNVIKI